MKILALEYIIEDCTSQSPIPVELFDEETLSLLESLDVSAVCDGGDSAKTELHSLKQQAQTALYLQKQQATVFTPRIKNSTPSSYIGSMGLDEFMKRIPEVVDEILDLQR